MVLQRVTVAIAYALPPLTGDINHKYSTGTFSEEANQENWSEICLQKVNGKMLEGILHLHVMQLIR